MTDTTGGRGGVGIRLFVSGGDVAKRTFKEVGDSGQKMWGQIALGDKAANPAIRALSAGVGEARNSMDGLAARAGPASSILSSFGAAGIAAAAGLGGLALALNKAQDAALWAAELTDTADRIGVGVEQLQRWNFVADEAGVSTQSLQANLEKLNGVLGAFKSGIGDAKLKPVFEELGITTEQMQNVRTADQLMMILADTLGQVQDRALQVKFARSLGIEESLPLLRLGSQGIRDLSDEAERLGLVMGKDVVQALDEADRKLELAQQRINSTVRLAVSDLAGDFADLVSQIAGAVVQLARWDAQVQRLSGAGQRPGRTLPSIVSDSLRGRSAEEGEAARDEGARNQPGWMSWLGFNQPRREAMDREQRMRAELNAIANGTGEYAPEAGGYDPRGHTARGAQTSRSNAEAERLREERERDRARETLDREELSARREAARLRWGGDTAEDRAQLAQSLLALDIQDRDRKRAALLADLDRLKAVDEATQINIDQLELLDREADQIRQRQIVETQRRELAEARLREEEIAERDAIEYLSIQERMAGTAQERYQIGRRILEAEQALERKLLQAAIDEDGRVTPGERRQIIDQQRNQDAELELFDYERTEELRRTFKSYGTEVVRAIEDGRIGEYIGDRIKERLLDGALDALFNSMGSGGKSGGGFWSDALNFGLRMISGGGSAGAPTKLPVKMGGKYAGGGYVSGPGGPREDRIPALLSNGEYVINAEATRRMRPLLDRINNGFAGFADGGFVGFGNPSGTAAETAQMVRDIGEASFSPASGSPAPQINMPPITINAQGADPAALERVKRSVDELNRTLEQRALEAVMDQRQRSHGRM